MKPSFKANSSAPAKTTTKSQNTENKLPPRKEALTFWEKQTKSGDVYFSVKLTELDGTIRWFNAFINKRNTDNDPKKPAFVAFHDEEK